MFQLNDIVREMGKLEEGIVANRFCYNGRNLNCVEYSDEKRSWFHDEDIELVGILVGIDL